MAAQVEEKYLGKIPREEGKLFDFLRDSKTIREMGFLEAGYLLAENTVYNFTLDKNDYAFNKSDVIGYRLRDVILGTLTKTTLFAVFSTLFLFG